MSRQDTERRVEMNLDNELFKIFEDYEAGISLIVHEYEVRIRAETNKFKLKVLRAVKSEDIPKVEATKFIVMPTKEKEG